MGMVGKQRTATKEELEQVRAILSPTYSEGLSEVFIDHHAETWVMYALGTTPAKGLKDVKSEYKLAGAQHALTVLNILRVFYPEIDSPLWETMQEDDL